MPVRSERTASKKTGRQHRQNEVRVRTKTNGVKEPWWLVAGQTCVECAKEDTVMFTSQRGGAGLGGILGVALVVVVYLAGVGLALKSYTEGGQGQDLFGGVCSQSSPVESSKG